MLPPAHAFLDPHNARRHMGMGDAGPAAPLAYDPSAVLASLPHYRPSKTVGPVERVGSHRANGRPIYHAPKWNGIGDARRIAFLRELAEHHADDPRMRFFVVNRVLRPAGVEPRDGRGAAAAILAWAQPGGRGGMYYANEKGEQIQIPWVTLEEKTGDCDDLNVLIGAMAMSIGLGWRQALAGRDPKTGQKVRWIEPAPGDRKSPRRPPSRVQWSHIYPVLGWPALAPNVWASAEPTLPAELAPLGYDVVVNGLPQGAASGRSTSDLAGAVALSRKFGGVYLGAYRPTAIQSRSMPAGSGVCQCPGDAEAAEADDSRTFLEKAVDFVEWDLILRDVIVSVASTIAVGWVLSRAAK